MTKTITVLIVSMLAAALILSACGSDDAQPSATSRSAPADQSAQTDQSEPAQSYQAGNTQSVEESQPADAEQQAPSSDQPSQQSQPAQQSTTDDQPSDADGSAGDQPEQEAMVGQIPDSGPYAGILINRHVLGDPNAAIVITEYSDFL